MNRFFRQYLILILGKYKHRNRKGLKIKTEENLLSFLTTTEIIKSIPLNRILIETDGPFSNFKGRPISPNDLSQVYNELDSEKFQESASKSDAACLERIIWVMERCEFWANRRKIDLRK